MDLKENRKDKVIPLALQVPLEGCSSVRSGNGLSQVDDFIEEFDGTSFSICGPQAVELLEMAWRAAYQSIARLPLKSVPILETVKLCYGSHFIPYNMITGWSYLPEENMIALAWNLDLNISVSLEEISVGQQVERVTAPRPIDVQTSCVEEGRYLAQIGAPSTFYLTYTPAFPPRKEEESSNVQEAP